MMNITEYASPLLESVNISLPVMDFGYASNSTNNVLPNALDPMDTSLILSTEYAMCDVENPNFNCTIDQFMLHLRGPKSLPLSLALLFTVLYVGTFIAGVVGNILVCIVIVRNSSMHSATNYYLFSLAVSDLIYLLFGLPFDLSLYWHQYPYSLPLQFCKMRALISEASTYVSVLTIVAFSMERFLAVCHPLHLYAMSGFKRAVRIIGVLWIVSFASAVPFGVYTKIHFIFYPLQNGTHVKLHESAFCAMLENPDDFPLWELSSCIFFAIPMVIMVVLYGRMGFQIRTRSKQRDALGVQQGSMHSQSHSNSRRAIIRMLAAVVITFFVSWAPFHAQRLMYLHAREWKHYDILNTWLFSVAGLFYYFSCTINPILYNVMSRRYRVAFKETLCFGKKKIKTYSNGYYREQSSFRETTLASTAGYEGMSRVRSQRHSRYKDREIVSSGVNWKPSDDSAQVLVKDTDVTEMQVPRSMSSTDVVVYMGTHQNGKPKCYKVHVTDQDSDSYSERDETCI